MSSFIFVTGTDTEVGKTTVACLLLRILASRKIPSLGLKPIASGAELSQGQLVNSDALLLQAASSTRLDYDETNPFCFKPAIAPHIAANQAGVTINTDVCLKHCNKIAGRYRSDICLIEGAGGWSVPLNEKELFSTLPVELGAQVLVVVGVRLGCINHALLTFEAIRRSGIEKIAWIANYLTPEDSVARDNVAAIKRFSNAQFIGEVEYGAHQSAQMLTGIDGVSASFCESFIDWLGGFDQ